jgi:hypothetical protein
VLTIVRKPRSVPLCPNLLLNARQPLFDRNPGGKWSPGQRAGDPFHKDGPRERDLLFEHVRVRVVVVLDRRVAFTDQAEVVPQEFGMDLAERGSDLDLGVWCAADS